MDDFSLARPAGHLIMGDGSGPDDLATKDGAKALSGAASVDTATTQVDKPSRTKNLITEWVCSDDGICAMQGSPSADRVGVMLVLLAATAGAPRVWCPVPCHGAGRMRSLTVRQASAMDEG
jgi:hypothetical protein